MKNVFPKAFAALIGLTLLVAAVAYVSHSQGWHVAEGYSSLVGTLLGGGLACGIMVFAVFMFISQMRSAIAIRKMRSEQHDKHKH